jgi:hypothetical protein
VESLLFIQGHSRQKTQDGRDDANDNEQNAIIPRINQVLHITEIVKYNTKNNKRKREPERPGSG